MTPGPADLRVSAAARTDVGKVRSQNEDACLVRPEAGLFVAADGMGGHAAGEVASALAVEAVGERLAPGPDASNGAASGPRGPRGAASGTARPFASGGTGRGGTEEARRAVREAVEGANRRIHRHARENPEQRGMGTTLTTLLLAGPRRWVVGQVGDSRAYLLREGELTPITTDHTVAPGSSTLTRALGTRESVSVDVLDGELESGDVFLLCSDGLTDMMSHDDIHAVLADALAGGEPPPAGPEPGGSDGAGIDGGAGPPAAGGDTAPAGHAPDEVAVRRAADALVEEVLDRGAHDNVTVVVVEVGEG